VREVCSSVLGAGFVVLFLLIRGLVCLTALLESAVAGVRDQAGNLGRCLMMSRFAGGRTGSVPRSLGSVCSSVRSRRFSRSCFGDAVLQLRGGRGPVDV
jgi:hypothetical protein